MIIGIVVAALGLIMALIGLFKKPAVLPKTLTINSTAEPIVIDVTKLENEQIFNIQKQIFKTRDENKKLTLKEQDTTIEQSDAIGQNTPIKQSDAIGQNTPIKQSDAIGQKIVRTNKTVK